MHSETAAANLRGFTQMTMILAHVANKPTHVGGAYRF
jgi:hypothetical protein